MFRIIQGSGVILVIFIKNDVYPFGIKIIFSNLKREMNQKCQGLNCLLKVEILDSKENEKIKKSESSTKDIDESV